MIKTLLEGQYSQAKLLHVRMHFSKEMDELGRFSVSKTFHLLKVILKIVYFRVFRNVSVLYYPPSPPVRLPVLRDLAILCTTRWMFKETIFHFHATGISEIYPSLQWFKKILFRWSFSKPDIAIQLSEYNPDDGAFFNARRQCLIPNGITDEYARMGNQRKEMRPICTLLSIGLIRESKGILVLIDAMRILAQKGIPVHAKVVGKFESPEFKSIVLNRIEELGLSGYFDFPGVLTGAEKHQVYLDADIFCSPTFFESFGLVVAEAMQFELPVVASKGQGVQSLVVESETGFLTEVRDSKAFADRIEMLVSNPELRCQMGCAGRRRYLEEYTVDKFHSRMDHCFSLIGQE